MSKQQLFSHHHINPNQNILCLLDFLPDLNATPRNNVFFPSVFNNSKADSDRFMIMFYSTVNFLSSCERGYKVFINANRQTVRIRASLVFDINGKR